MTRINACDNLYSAARSLAECADSGTRAKALEILTGLIETVDHSADMLGALGLLMEMDRRGVYGLAVVTLHQRCQGDLTAMAMHLRGRPLVKPVKPVTKEVVVPSIGVEQIVGELATRLEALALKTDSVELLEEADTLRRGGATIGMSAQTMGLLNAILKDWKLSDNYKGVNKVVFGK